MIIIGFCALILFSSFSLKEQHQKNAGMHTRAMAALVSEADIIRSGLASTQIGPHDFVRADRLLAGLPRAKGSYAVSTMKEVRGLLRIRIRVAWQDRFPHKRELEIFVNE